MPFKRPSAFRLSLAIAAIITSPALLASTGADRLWTCNLNAAGDWDCEVNEQLLQHDQPVPVLGAPAPAPVHEERLSRPTEIRTLDAEPGATADTASPEIQTSPEAVEIAAPGTATDVEVTPVAVSPAHTATTAPATASQQTQVRGRSADAWDCTVGSDGNWRCAAGHPTAVPAGSVAALSARYEGGLSAVNPFAHLDWQVYTQPDGGICSGRYVEPQRDFLEAEGALAQQPVFAEADNSTADLNTGLAKLMGGVQLRQGGRMFTSRYGELDQNQRTAFLEGDVTYREPGLLMVGERVDTNFDSGDSSFDRAQFVMHAEHLRGQANRITRYGDDRVQFERGQVTYCEPGNNAWAIASRDIMLYPDEGYGVAKHTTFRVKDVPVLYLPWFRFPIDDRRQSGFLYPSVGVSKGDGFDLSIPYYFNIAPNVDDTLTVRHIEKRGLMLENELRYMNTWSHNELALGYLGNDSREQGDDRWLLGMTHRGAPVERWTTRLDYTRVSDNDYFDDLGTSLEVQRDDHLDQRGQVTYRGDGWNFLANIHKYQTITNSAASPYERVPQLLLTGGERLDSGLALNYTAEYTYFDRDLDGAITGHRTHLRPTLSYDFRRPWAYVNPALSVWHSQYDLNRSDTDSMSAVVASIDSGLYFDRDFSWAGNSYSQSLEPRLMLLSVNRTNELPHVFDSSRMGFSYYNLFDRYGWSGNDRVSATEQASVGVSSGLYNDSGREVARLAVAQAHYFSDRDPADLRPGDVDGSDSSSNLALLAQWNMTPYLRLSMDAEIDRDDYSFEEQNYRLTWLPDRDNMFYFSYRDRQNTARPNQERIRQSDIAFRHQLDPRWGIIGRWQHDIEYRQRLDTLMGLEYGTCCWKMRLTAREWLKSDRNSLTVGTAEYDRGVFVQFVLRGLGSFGGEGGRGLIEEATGFRERDHDEF